MLQETGAWMKGHFELTTGRHSPEFFLLAKLMQYPDRAAWCGERLAEYFREFGITAVVGPAMGGIILAHEVARALSARALFAERGRDGHDSMKLRRGFTLADGERVLVVEDAVTTGGSAQQAIAAVRAAGGQPVAVGAVVDRSGGEVDFGLPFKSLLTLKIPDYSPADCPLCAQGIPLSRPKL